MKIISLAWLTLLSLFFTSCSTSSSTAQNVVVGDSKIAYATKGDQTPLIVLEVGLGDGRESWDKVFASLSKKSKVFSYDRPGYGDSEKTARARTPEQIVEDLRVVLKESGNEPPYILVGHSLGGTYMLYYAAMYPDEVAGLVLAEGRHPDFSARCQKAGIDICDVPSAIYALWGEQTQKEYDAMQSIETRAYDLGDMPLVVLTRTPRTTLLESQAFVDLWMQTQEELATLSTNSQHVIADDSGHYIHQDAPELLYEAIDRILANQ